MAASNEVRFKIGADTSALSAGFAKAQSIAAAAGKQIEKKLGLRDAFRSSVLALGLSIENIAEKVANIFTGGSREGWSAALSAAERTTQLMDQAAMRRLTTIKQIEVLEAKIQANQQNTSKAPRMTNGVLQSAAGFLGITPGKGMMGTLVNALSMENEAEATERSETAKAKIAADEALITEAKAQQQKITDQIADAEDELQRLRFSDEKRHAALLEDAERIKAARDEAMKKGGAWQQLQLAYVAKLISAESLLLSIEKEKTSEGEKQTAQGKRLSDLLANRNKALDAKAGAQGAIAMAKRDQFAFTLEEAAAGERGTKDDQRRAQQILHDEEMARKLYGTGKTEGEFVSARGLGFGFAPEGVGKVFQRNAGFYRDRANRLREGFTNLRSGEKNQFAGVEKQLTNANEHLASIDKALAETEL